MIMEDGAEHKQEVRAAEPAERPKAEGRKGRKKTPKKATIPRGSVVIAMVTNGLVA